MEQASPRIQHLFIVKVWYEPSLTGQGQWRGMAEHPATGKRIYFTSLQDPADFIASFTRPDPAGSQEAPASA